MAPPTIAPNLMAATVVEGIAASRPTIFAPVVMRNLLAWPAESLAVSRRSSHKAIDFI